MLSDTGLFCMSKIIEETIERVTVDKEKSSSSNEANTPPTALKMLDTGNKCKITSGMIKSDDISGSYFALQNIGDAYKSLNSDLHKIVNNAVSTYLIHADGEETNSGGKIMKKSISRN